MRVSAGILGALACTLEALARKPGNVHRGRDFDDLHLLDFLLASSAIVRALDRARGEGVGRAVLAGVEETRGVVATNVNLGLLLILAPLAAVQPKRAIGEDLPRVLRELSISDARLVYRAIRRAEPGGLGSVEEQDVRGEPTVTLREAMALASERDMIARQYVEDFAQVFDPTFSTLSALVEEGRPLEVAIIAAHLRLLADFPDTLIARRRGREEALEASRRAGEVLGAGWPDSSRAVELAARFDAWLRAEGHSRSPGTTADLVAGALYIAFREETIPLPTDWSGFFPADGLEGPRPAGFDRNIDGGE